MDILTQLKPLLYLDILLKCFNKQATGKMSTVFTDLIFFVLNFKLLH